jgi:hypothetical protein
LLSASQDDSDSEEEFAEALDRMNAAEQRAKGPGGDWQERASSSGESRPLLLYPFEVSFCAGGPFLSFAAVLVVVCGAALDASLPYFFFLLLCSFFLKLFSINKQILAQKSKVCLPLNEKRK